MSSFLDVHERWLVERGAEPLPDWPYPDEPPPPASWPAEILAWFGSDVRKRYGLSAFALGWHWDTGLGIVGYETVTASLYDVQADASRYPGDPVELWMEPKSCAVIAATTGADAGVIFWFDTLNLSFGRLASSLSEYFEMVRASVDAGVATVGNDAPRWIDDLRPRPDSTSDAPSPPRDTPAAIFGFPRPTIGDVFSTTDLTNPIAASFQELL